MAAHHHGAPSVDYLKQALRSNANGVGVAIRAARGRVLRAARAARAKKLRFNQEKVRALITHIQNTQANVEAEVGEFIQSPHLLFRPLQLSLALSIPMLLPLYFMPARLLLVYPAFILTWYTVCALYFATEVAMRPPWYKQGLPLSDQPYYWSHYIHDPRIDLALDFEHVSFRSPSGSLLRAWFIPAQPSPPPSPSPPSPTPRDDDNAHRNGDDGDGENDENDDFLTDLDLASNDADDSAATAAAAAPPPAHNNMVVFVHGVGRDRRAFLRHSEHFVRRGYACLLFDFSEHGLSDNLTPGLPRGSLFGAREQHDVAAAVQYLKRERGADRVALVGTSCGAVSAILAAAAQPHLAACVVAENPFTRADHLLRYHLHTLSSNYLSQNSHQTVRQAVFWLAGKLLMLRMGHYLQSWGPIDAVAALACPLLVAHSTEDDIVPYAHGRAIYEAAARAKEHLPGMVQFCSFSDAAHCALYDKDPKKWTEAVLRFVDDAFEKESRKEK